MQVSLLHFDGTDAPHDLLLTSAAIPGRLFLTRRLDTSQFMFGTACLFCDSAFSDFVSPARLRRVSLSIPATYHRSISGRGLEPTAEPATNYLYPSEPSTAATDAVDILQLVHHARAYQSGYYMMPLDPHRTVYSIDLPIIGTTSHSRLWSAPAVVSRRSARRFN